jgi:hypothetical protein
MRYELANRVKQEFRRGCPAGWACHFEHGVLRPDFVDLLGYRPQADVMLENPVSADRIWIELEISRADPVANHAKFGSAHLLQPFPRKDRFVSLVSRHVAPGRSNLAAHTIYLLRSIGLRAFQIPLFPDLSGPEIKQLNHAAEQVDIPVIDVPRVIRLTREVGVADGVEICYATNPFEVLLNAANWNRDVSLPDRRGLWGRRRVKYFVFDQKRTWFAPSKFCAYTIMRVPSDSRRGLGATMEVPLYVEIDYENKIFDGNLAWRNLLSLGFRKIRVAEGPPEYQADFAAWLNRHADLFYADIETSELLFLP